MLESKTELPDLLQEGLDKYLDNNAFAAVRIWTYGSIHHLDEYIQEKTKVLLEFEYIYGSFRGYVVEDVHLITTTIHLISLIFKYGDFSVPSKFFAYRQSKNWILPNFTFSNSSKIAKVFLI